MRTFVRMIQVLLLSALAGGAGYFFFWYLYLGVVWLSRLGGDSYLREAGRLNVTPFELPTALVCMLVAAAFLAAGSWGEVDQLQAQLDRRELDDKISEIETKQRQTY